ncbi:hypothetical protein BDQ12DRAFT_688035 [Crucibulum laeve]|uniref:Uncharacterized protein n=1 Tax=Crucibulum laeve TaxID=68775 RepID=A0A5C3LTA3_9AGAR|nr:hypothetical protein BDQ12DRAFT_688035 [Crucibulum laeve]
MQSSKGDTPLIQVEDWSCAGHDRGAHVRDDLAASIEDSSVPTSSASATNHLAVSGGPPSHSAQSTPQSRLYQLADGPELISSKISSKSQPLSSSASSHSRVCFACPQSGDHLSADLKANVRDDLTLEPQEMSISSSEILSVSFDAMQYTRTAFTTISEVLWELEDEDSKLWQSTHAPPSSAQHSKPYPEVFDLSRYSRPSTHSFASISISVDSETKYDHHSPLGPSSCKSSSSPAHPRPPLGTVDHNAFLF